MISGERRVRKCVEETVGVFVMWWLTESLGSNIRQLVVSRNMNENDPIVVDVLANEVKSHWNVSGLGVDAWILGERLGSAVVYEDGSSFLLWETNFLQ